MSDEEFLRAVERLGATVIDTELDHDCSDCGLTMKVRPIPAVREEALRVRAEARRRLGPLDAAKVEDRELGRWPWLEVD